MTLSWTIAPIDIYNAGDEQYAALHRFASAIRAERLPDDPPTGLEEFVGRTKNIPKGFEYSAPRLP